MPEDYTEIELQERAGYTRIALNRPKALNAYTTRMCEELVDAVDRFARNDESRALVLTGNGRGFCSGGDLVGDAEMEKAEQRQLGHASVMREAAHPVMRALVELDKPTIAAVNGPAVAGGLAFALACDIRIGSDRAVLGDTSGVAGLLPDEGGAWLFTRAMGFDRALKMVYLNEKYDAATAYELGLLTEVVPDAELDSRTDELAGALAQRAPLSVRLSKWMMNRARSMTFEQSLGDAQMAVMIANSSDDAAEGIEAFGQKRAPQFRGG